MDLYEFMQESNARANRGRRLAHLMFAAALLALAIPAFLFIAAPNGPTAMYLEEPPAFHAAIPFIGVVGMVIGFVWMVRIFRADPEPETKGWRYRD